MINHPQPEMGWISIPNLVVCGINGLPHYVTSQVLQLFHNHGILQMIPLIIQIHFYIAGQFLHHPRYLPGPSRESSPCSLGPRVRVLVFCCVIEMWLQWNPLFKASDTGEARWIRSCYSEACVDFSWMASKTYGFHLLDWQGPVELVPHSVSGSKAWGKGLPVNSTWISNMISVLKHEYTLCVYIYIYTYT